jgi:aryl-alcohol dehydrogenase-like predicted oxidoreductase
MEQVQLGRTGILIGRIGFGCMSLKELNKENEKLLIEAIDNGINYFDTADLYDRGNNEILLGKIALERRNQMVIATKVGNQWKADGSGWDWNPTRKYIMEAAEQSLRRLQTDHIDLYQLHGGTLEDPIDETIDAFDQLVKEGKILHYGISSIRPNVIREWVEKSRMASVMIQYSLLDRRPEEVILPYLKQQGIAVLARGSVAQGLLVDKPPKIYLDHSAEQVAAASEAVRSLSGKERSPAQVAISYVLESPGISCAVVGIRNRQQLREAAQATTNPLTADELGYLRSVIPLNYYSAHR